MKTIAFILLLGLSTIFQNATAQEYSTSIFQFNTANNNGYWELARNMLRIMRTGDFYVTASGNYYLFPSGIRQISGTSIAANDIKPLAETQWGLTYWFGKVMMSQYYTINTWQPTKSEDPKYQIDERSGFFSMSLGYAAYEVIPNASSLRLRFAPVAELGFGGIILPDERNRYLSAGAAMEVSCVIPITDMNPHPERHTFTALAANVAVRAGFSQHFSAVDFTPSQGMFILRATFGIGIHYGIDPNYQEQF